MDKYRITIIIPAIQPDPTGKADFTIGKSQSISTIREAKSAGQALINANESIARWEKIFPSIVGGFECTVMPAQDNDNES